VVAKDSIEGKTPSDFARISKSTLERMLFPIRTRVLRARSKNDCIRQKQSDILLAMVDQRNIKEKLQGARVLILTGPFRGKEGVCLGEETPRGRWAVSPDGSDEILSLAFETDFGLVVDLSADPQRN